MSDTQVEQYGNTVTPERPEADDRDHQIETHLADCSACRERVLAVQRTFFSQFADSKMNTGQNARRPGSANPDSPGPGPDCPDENDLRDLAAGLSPTDVALKLTRHAAQCDHCGPLLRMYTEDFSDQVSEDDHAALAKLQSSSPSGQKKLVEAMLAASGRSSPKPSKKPFPWRWVLAPAALAACAAIAFAVWYQERETPEKVAKLLGEAYTENRQLEMRIPYAKHAEFHQLRSGDGESLLNKPAELRKAADVIQAQLRKNPDDPRWLLLSARLNLLDRHTKPALAALDQIEDERILGSPDFLITRALALYESASADPQQAKNYAAAFEVLSSVLKRSPNDGVALYNRALICEKLKMYECAVADWTRLVEIERDPGWSAEAREHLNGIREKKSLELRP